MQLIFKNLNTGDKNQDSVIHVEYAWIAHAVLFLYSAFCDVLKESD